MSTGIVLRMLFTVHILSSPIVVTLMMEVIPEDVIFQQ
jgi:hypothetical protein